jgi:hypothetical protein
MSVTSQTFGVQGRKASKIVLKTRTTAREVPGTADGAPARQNLVRTTGCVPPGKAGYQREVFAETILLGWSQRQTIFCARTLLSLPYLKRDFQSCYSSNIGSATRSIAP